jgi:hypothetical protein
MTRDTRPRFSVVQMEKEWFWSSHSMLKARGKDALIGPFPSQQEAEKDARSTLELKDGEGLDK